MTDVTVRSLARTYAARPPVPALRGVDLDLPSGSLTAVLGPSGCGKTTLLRLLAGFDRPDEGTITLGDQVVSSPGRVVPPERRRVGIVPQEGALFPHLDVGANVAFGLRGSGPLGRLSGGRRRRDRDTGEPGTGAPGDHHGGRTQDHDGAEEVPDRAVEAAGPDPAAVAPAGPRDLTRGQRDRRVAEVLELVGLGGFERRRPHELSGGQQQRVALARALAPEPKVVLLDEPFTALDAGLRSSLRSQVAASLAAAGTTALLVTHDQEEALTMADHLAVMREGRIVQSGTPADAYRHPADVGVAQFLGEAVLVPATVRGRTLECRLGVVALAAEAPVGDGMEVMACLRPEQLVHDRDPGAVMATVEAVEYQGHDAVLSLRLDGLALLARWPSFDLPRAGDRVGLRLVGDAVAFPAPPSTVV